MPTRQGRYMARKRQEWKAAGLCVYCGQDSGGKRRCSRCRESLRKNQAARRLRAAWRS